jgi:hypothetical protein
MYWLADIRDKATGRSRISGSALGRAQGRQTFVVSADEYRQEIARSAQRLTQITGRKPCRCIVRRAARHRRR